MKLADNLKTIATNVLVKREEERKAALKKKYKDLTDKFMEYAQNGRMECWISDTWICETIHGWLLQDGINVGQVNQNDNTVRVRWG